VQQVRDSIPIQCLTPDDVYQLSGLSEEINPTHLSTLASIILHLSHSKQCDHNTNSAALSKRPHIPPTAGQGIILFQ